MRPRERIISDLQTVAEQVDRFPARTDEEPYSLTFERQSLRQWQQSLEEEYEHSFGLRWTLDGEAIVGHEIPLALASDALGELQRALDRIGEDDGDARRAGGPPIGARTQGRLAGTFRGSFGLRILPPRTTEQLDFDHRAVFDRAMFRILQVLASGNSTSPDGGFDPGPIVSAVNGLSSRSVSALRDLTGALANSKVMSRMEWRPVHGEDVPVLVDVPPAAARRINEVLAATRDEPEPVVLRGVMTGVLREALTFTMRSEADVTYRGSFAANRAQEIANAVSGGWSIQATLEAHVPRADVATAKRPTYKLLEFERLPEPPRLPLAEPGGLLDDD